MIYTFFIKSIFKKILPISTSIYISKRTVFCEYDRNKMYQHKSTLTNTNTFKKNFENYVPVKVIGSNKKNFQYKLGLNINNEKFIANDSNDGGGLYFCDITDILHNYHMDYYGDKIAYIELIDNEPIWINTYYLCKTNQFNIIKIENKIEAISKYVNNLSEQEQLKLIETNPHIIKLITNKSKIFLLQAIKTNILLTNEKYIKKKSTFHQYINNLSKQEQLETIKLYPQIIKLIENMSDNFVLEAININNDVFNYIEYPFLNVYINNLTEQEQLEIIKLYPRVIYSITNMSDQFMLKALKINVDTMDYIEYLELKILYYKCYSEFYNNTKIMNKYRSKKFYYII